MNAKLVNENLFQSKDIEQIVENAVYLFDDRMLNLIDAYLTKLNNNGVDIEKHRDIVQKMISLRFDYNLTYFLETHEQ